MSSSASPPPMASSSSLTDNNTGAIGIEEVQQQVASAVAISSGNSDEHAASGGAPSTSGSTATSVSPASPYASSLPLNRTENILDDNEHHPIAAAAMTAEEAEYEMNKKKKPAGKKLPPPTPSTTLTASAISASLPEVVADTPSNYEMAAAMTRAEQGAVKMGKKPPPPVLSSSSATASSLIPNRPEVFHTDGDAAFTNPENVADRNDSEAKKLAASIAAGPEVFDTPSDYEVAAAMTRADIGAVKMGKKPPPPSLPSSATVSSLIPNRPEVFHTDGDAAFTNPENVVDRNDSDAKKLAASLAAGLEIVGDDGGGAAAMKNPRFHDYEEEEKEDYDTQIKRKAALFAMDDRKMPPAAAASDDQDEESVAFSSRVSVSGESEEDVGAPYFGGNGDSNHEETDEGDIEEATAVTPPSSEILPEATPVPPELEASVHTTRGQQQPSTEAIYPMAVEIYNDNDENNHGVSSRWKRIAGSLGVLLVSAIVMISILMLQNTNGLPSDTLNITPQPIPSLSPSVGLLPSTPNPKLVLSPKPSLFPTAYPTTPPSTSPTSIPTALPTEGPTTSPAFSPAPSTMPTFTLPTDCARAKLEKKLVAEGCVKCNVYVAVDGAFAITTADKDVLIYNLVDGLWKQKQSITVGTSSLLTLAISGNVVVVGAPLENGETGAVYIYEWDPISNVWNLATQLAPADLTSGAKFGFSVAVDGDVVVVGAYNDRVGRIGSAYIFRRDGSGGGWSQEDKLAPEDADLESFGFSVDVKGNTVVVGDLYYGSGKEGSAFVYKYNTKSSTWSQFQDNIRNDDCDSLFGGSVVLTEDGELFIGCEFEDSYAGAVYHYAPSNNGGLYEMQQKITASDRSAGDYFGAWGQVSVDGNVMVVGLYNANQGQVYVYARDSPSGSWMEVTIILAPSGETLFGHWVALSVNKLLVGAENNAYAYLLYSCSVTPS